jgi:SpoVK/Ycf46/Vps4 family AAA+-type ATPase
MTTSLTMCTCRILVDLPTTENRVKILRVILAEEELAEGFDYEELSRITDGYSGSDLKVLIM